MSDTSWLAERFARADRSGRAVTCHYCHRAVFVNVPPSHPRRATVDHRIPKCRLTCRVHGNRVIACARCNHSKGPLTDTEFKAVRNDALALKRKVREVYAALDPSRPFYESTGARKRARRERAFAEVGPPKDGCQLCGGSGSSPRGRHPCPCTALDDERLADVTARILAHTNRLTS